MSPAANATGEPRLVERREPQGVEKLAPTTVQWLASLPPKARPRLLPVDFPRIANRLSSKWAARQDCLDYLEDLLLDRRGNRCGFPTGVLLELAALKDHFETGLHHQPQTVWDEITDRRRDR